MAITPTTWSPTDKGPYVTLSNGNKTADLGSQSVRSVFGASSGKYYFEFKFSGSTGQMVGVATSAASVSTWPGADTHAWAWERASGSIYHGGGAIYTGTAGATTVGVLLDCDNKKVQFRRNNANIGPAVNIAGTTFYAIAGYYDSVIANFGATAFTYAVPSGYSSGFGNDSSTVITGDSSVLLDDAWSERLAWPTTWSPTDKTSGAALIDPTTADLSTTGGIIRSADGVDSGKWYWEVAASNTGAGIGIALKTAGLDNYLGSDIRGWALYGEQIYNSGGVVATVSPRTNPTVGIALDLDSRLLWYVIDGVHQTPIALPSGKFYAAFSYLAIGAANFGARTFEFNPPPGFNHGLGFLTEPGMSSDVILDDALSEGEIELSPWVNLDYYGWVSDDFGQPEVAITKLSIYPDGFDELVVSGSGISIENMRQFIDLAYQENGIPAPEMPAHSAGGGVAAVEPIGWDDAAFGTPELPNFVLSPEGFSSSTVGEPSVSPQILRPSAIHGTGAGYPVVQFPPRATGWLSSALGYPVIEYKTRVARLAGIDSLGFGFPAVRDRASYLLHQSSPVNAIFGDVQVRLSNRFLRPAGFSTLQTSDWALVENTRRHLTAPGNVFSVFGVNDVRNASPALWAVGIASQSFGAHDVGHRIRRVIPSGIAVPFPQFLQPSLWQTPSIAPFGLEPPQIPQHTIWPRTRSVEAAGELAEKFGSQTVSFRWREVPLEDFGVRGDEYGDARVEHAIRGFEVLGQPWLEFGDAWVSRGRRALEPVGIQEPLLSRHQIGGTRWIGPEGFESTRWLTRITPENREVFPKTFGAEYGLPTVQNRKRPVFPAGIRTYLEEGQHWGTARVWNLRQVVTMYEDQESGLWPLPWPQWTAIENRNKVMRASGFNAGRVGGAVVANNARLVQPSGIDHPVLPEYQKTGAVTHRVRHLPMDGIEAPMMSRWAVVHNGARPLLPQGFAATQFGLVDLVNLRRKYKLQGFYSTELGAPFIDYRIRTLSFESRYGIHPPRIDLPSVFLSTRYVEPLGVPERQVGNASLTTFFRRATPRWTHRDMFGDAFVWNKTPELHTRGRASDEFGDALVRLEWRPLQQEGQDTQLFGVTRISDRRQWLDAPGMSHTVVSDKVTVLRTGEEPVVTQYIDLRKFAGEDGAIESDDGYGIPYPWPAAGIPSLLEGYIFHGVPSGADHDMVRWGRPTVHANGIRVEPGIFDFYVGEPFVALRNRQIDTKSLGQMVKPSSSIGAMGSWGLPRISPHTIYAVVEAPPQAKRNHFEGETILYPVNEGARLGQPSVTTWLKDVEPIGIAGEGNAGSFGVWGVGAPSLINLRQYVAPYGTLMQRIGWPTIPGPQDILIEEPIGGHVVGTPHVSPPPYSGPLTLYPEAFEATAGGSASVDLFNRTLLPDGWASEEFGKEDPLGSVNMPQGLYVGPPNLHQQDGFDSAEFGIQWVSLWVRDLQPKGHDSFLSEYDIENFAKRMRVRNANDSWGGRRSVLTHGHQSSRVGAPGVRPGTHYIRPDGNSDQYRKGAF